MTSSTQPTTSLILGIETSCDETAAAVVEDGRRLRSNVIASQFHLHAPYGGVVPEVASRHHLEVILQVIDAALAEAGVGWRDLAGVAVTAGPGLAGALLVGVNTAKTLAYTHDLPLLGVNHLEAHLYANWLEVEGREYRAPELPALGLIVSGGHTDLILMSSHGRYERLGRTRDDAAGEAFDKVGRLLGLGFPGGPAVERAARGVAKPRLRLPRAWLKGSDDFSFACYGLPAFGLGALNWDYGDYTWHTNRDTYDKIVFDDLKSNATLTAMLAYEASEDPSFITRERIDLAAAAAAATAAQGTGNGARGRRGGFPTTWPACEKAPRETKPRLK